LIEIACIPFTHFLCNLGENKQKNSGQRNEQQGQFFYQAGPF